MVRPPGVRAHGGGGGVILLLSLNYKFEMQYISLLETPKALYTHVQIRSISYIYMCSASSLKGGLCALI